MAKGNASEKTPKDQGNAIKEFLKALASAVLRNKEDLKRAQLETGLAKSSLEHMKVYGKGSASSWIKLLAYATELPLAELPNLSAKFRGLVSRVENLDDFDRLLEEARRRYSEAELYAWLRLLVARSEIEQELGLRPKRKRP